jgi:FMN phosphatase YigB (HAD superfamily)
MQTLTERMGVAAASCLVIGDREDTDGEMARKAGADFCLVFSERAQSATV